MLELLRLVFSGFAFFGIIASAVGAATRTCTVSPLGNGQDDTDQVRLNTSRWYTSAEPELRLPMPFHDAERMVMLHCSQGLSISPGLQICFRDVIICTNEVSEGK